MSMAQCQQLHELQKKAGLIMGKNTPESSNTIEATVALLEEKTDDSSNESLLANEMPKVNKKHNPVLDRKGSDTSQSHADTFH